MTEWRKGGLMQWEGGGILGRLMVHPCVKTRVVAMQVLRICAERSSGEQGGECSANVLYFFNPE